MFSPPPPLGDHFSCFRLNHFLIRPANIGPPVSCHPILFLPNVLITPDHILVERQFGAEEECNAVLTCAGSRPAGFKP